MKLRAVHVLTLATLWCFAQAIEGGSLLTRLPTSKNANTLIAANHTHVFACMHMKDASGNIMMTVQMFKLDSPAEVHEYRELDAKCGGIALSGENDEFLYVGITRQKECEGDCGTECRMLRWDLSAPLDSVSEPNSGEPLNDHSGTDCTIFDVASNSTVVVAVGRENGTHGVSGIISWGSAADGTFTTKSKRTKSNGGDESSSTMFFTNVVVMGSSEAGDFLVGSRGSATLWSFAGDEAGHWNETASRRVYWEPGEEDQKVHGDITAMTALGDGTYLVAVSKDSKAQLQHFSVIPHGDGEHNHPYKLEQGRPKTIEEDEPVMVLSLNHHGDDCEMCGFQGSEMLFGSVHVDEDAITIQQRKVSGGANAMNASCHSVQVLHDSGELVFGGAVHIQMDIFGESVTAAVGITARMDAVANSEGNNPSIGTTISSSAVPSISSGPPPTESSPTESPETESSPTVSQPSVLSGVGAMSSPSPATAASNGTMSSVPESNGTPPSPEGSKAMHRPIYGDTDEENNTTTIAITAAVIILFLLAAVGYYLYAKYWKRVAPTPDLHRFTRMEQEMSDV